MAAQSLHLSKGTAALLSQLPETSAPPTAIKLFGNTIGLCHSPKLPSRVALPGGVWLDGNAKMSAQDAVENAPALQLPQVVALRYCRRLCIASSVFNGADVIAARDQLIVGGKVFSGNGALRDIVPESEVSTAWDVQVFRRVPLSTRDGGVAGLIILQEEESDSDDVVVDVDVLAYCALDATQTEVVESLNSALRSALNVARDVADDFDVRMRHYAVFGGGVIVTIVTPQAEEGEDEGGAAMVGWRQIVHEELLLPTDRPMLRRMCRVYCDSDVAGAELTNGGWKGRLADVHVGVKGHGLGGEAVTVHMVQGRYLYCHYMQDKFNDSGWGCAYRSLQTILSWCAWERYVTFKGGLLPTHEEIQKALVAVGDKPNSLIGSKEWIGANEVCYALEKLTGVASKILHVSSGAEMGSQGRLLAKHFDEQGSPVMVGGGVLAWTILGVARNEMTGRTKFLILDPHYEGRDDLATIQSKGWVGWKAADIFKAEAFYNLCMPERPSGI